MSEENPFDDLAEEGVDPDADADELFTEVRVDDVDDEAVWDALTEGDVPGRSVGETGGGANGADADGAPLDDDGEGVVVPKGSYCQQCEHFSAPPGVACGNPGTDIVELVDVDRFRVRDCPVVERRRSATRTIGDEE